MASNEKILQIGSSSLTKVPEIDEELTKVLCVACNGCQLDTFVLGIGACSS